MSPPARQDRPTTGIVLSCEHGGNDIPPEFAARCRPLEAAFQSHRGWDPGALGLARDIGCALGVEPHVCVVSRLLIDTNRGLRSPRLFTDDTLSLSSEERAHLIATVHRPHQDAVAASVVSALDAHDRVLYLSVHSFTPVLAGDVRDVDVGILFDPARDPEVAFAAAWMRSLRAAAPSLRVRPNAPYSGLDEGLDRDLRERFRDRPLLALTLEVNQAIPLGPPGPWEALRAALTASLVSVLGQE